VEKVNSSSEKKEGLTSKRGERESGKRDTHTLQETGNRGEVFNKWASLTRGGAKPLPKAHIKRIGKATNGAWVQGRVRKGNQGVSTPEIKRPQKIKKIKRIKKDSRNQQNLTRLKSREQPVGGWRSKKKSKKVRVILPRGGGTQISRQARAN